MTLVPQHQKEVDDLFSRIRAEGAVPAKRLLFKPAQPRPQPSQDEMDHRIAEELGTIKRRLELLGDILSREPMLLNRHAAQLQSIDLMMQQLGHLENVVVAEDKQGAAEKVTLQELRQRLTRKAVRPILV